ncbi:MAG: PKD domain-containing protein [Euryarchaeota archaeon]|nr:PKD domain-containing protein [Euryarchaeota archaeon]
MARINGKEGIYAFAPDGTEKWYYPSLLIYTGSPTVARNGSIYFFVCRERYNNVSLIMLNSDGTLKWEKTLLNAYPHGYPVIDDKGMIYFLTSYDSVKLIALNPDSGNFLWTYDIQGHVHHQSPAIGQNGVIYFGQGDTLFAINQNGTKKWQRSFPAILLNGSQVLGRTTVETPSIADDGTVYVLVQDEKEWQTLTDHGWYNGLHAIDPQNPYQERWSAKYIRTSRIEKSPTIDSNGNIYIAGGFSPAGTWSTTLYGFDPQGNNLENWPLNLGYVGRAELLVVDKEGIIYGIFGWRGTVKAFNRNGTQKWSLSGFDSYSDIPPSLGKDGILYIPSWKWLYAINPNISTNHPPNSPTNLAQFKSDSVTEIPVGGATDERTVIFKGEVSDPDGDKVILQVELRRLDEYGGQFDETQGGLKDGVLVESGSEAVACTYGLIDADYHWRARAVDEHGEPSEWVDFGDNDISKADFTVTGITYSYDPQAAVNYAEKHWKNYNSTDQELCDYYQNYSGRGGDCANFVSQCLIAGGLDLTEHPGHDTCGSIINCTNLHDFLVNYLGVTWDTRYKSEEDPEWFKPGDPAIFGYSDAHPRTHAVFAVTGDATQPVTCNAHTANRHHNTTQEFYDYSKDDPHPFDRCTFYHIPSPAKPVITSPLEITTKEVYYVGDTLTANFTITNRGTESITFDVLVVGGRDPAGEVVDFDKAYDITLNQGDSYNYQGSVTLPDKLGIYHFFCAYHTEEHMPGEDDYNWNTNIDVEINGEIVEDFNEAQMYRVRAIIVFDESYISPAPPPAVWEKIDGPWDSWPKRKEPLEIAVNPNDPDEIYVSAILQWGNLGEQAGGKLYKSTDGGGSWNPINQGLPQFGDFYRPIRAIAISPSNPDIVYVGTSTLQPYSSNSAKFGAGGIYKSTNGGLGWAAVNGPCKILPGVYYPISSMIVDPTNSDIVYIGTVGGGIWRTTNGGSSYEKIWDESGETLLDVISLAISPADHSIIYAAAYNFKPLCTMGWSSVLTQNRLIKFKDGGNTWETLLRSRLSPYPKIEDIVVDYKNTDIVYVITQTFDVYKIDGDENIYDVSGNAGSDPLPNPCISGPEVGRSNTIAMDPRFSNVIYAARRGEGVYLSPNSGKNWFPIGLQEGHWLKNLVFATNADTHVIYAASGELYKLDISNSAIVVSGHCPIELRVYDSQGRITGLVNGEIKEEIPNSGYINNTAMIFSPNISYRYEVIGTDNGTYGLSMFSVENGTDTDFFISNLSTQTNATHEYTVNWTILSQGGAGVTLKIDADGDGEFEETITIQPPIANFTYTPENPVVNQTITFDASNSTDLDGNITSYKWDFGDETNGTGEKPSHSYSSAGNYIVTVTVRDNDGATTSTSKTITIYPSIFDTDSPANPYPSIAGAHNGTITPSYNISVSKLYTYPCAGTGGHTEYAAFSYSNGTIMAEAHWNGYEDDWHNISFNKTFTLYENETYNYTIKTGSYPQIIHNRTLLTANGWINCTKFTDANGKVYYDWIPAIRLWA